MSKVEKILAELKRPKIEKEIVRPAHDFLSCGSTLGDLAMSGHVEGAFAKGGYYHVVGTSDSGKSYLSLTTFAEASRNKHFKDYRFIHDEPEKGTLMDYRKFFGAAMYDRVEPPAGTKHDPKDSQSIDDFYYNLDDAISKKRPFIYVLDSMDALYAEPDRKKFKAKKNAARKARKAGEEEEDVKGSYGMAKAKANSDGMRLAYSGLEATGSILIIIGQAKVDMTWGAPPGSLTYAGGKSLKFYCHGQMWTRNIGDITKKLTSGRTKQQGIKVEIEASKNRHNGRHTKVRLPIYWSTGIDDTGSMVDWLTYEGRWKVDDGKIRAKELEMVLPREELIQRIEAEDAEDEVRKIVVAYWQEIQQALVPVRKMKYGTKE